MSVRATIVDGPVPERWTPDAPSARDECGTCVRFEGLVRRAEQGRALAALSYEVYEPMAARELARLGAEVVARHGVLDLSVIHSRGRVPVGKCSLVVAVRSAHRREALAAVGEFIDLLKRDVPIWKRAEWA